MMFAKFTDKLMDTFKTKNVDINEDEIYDKYWNEVVYAKKYNEFLDNYIMGLIRYKYRSKISLGSGTPENMIKKIKELMLENDPKKDDLFLKMLVVPEKVYRINEDFTIFEEEATTKLDAPCENSYEYENIRRRGTVAKIDNFNSVFGNYKTKDIEEYDFDGDLKLKRYAETKTDKEYILNLKRHHFFKTKIDGATTEPYYIHGYKNLLLKSIIMTSIQQNNPRYLKMCIESKDSPAYDFFSWEINYNKFNWSYMKRRKEGTEKKLDYTLKSGASSIINLALLLKSYDSLGVIMNSELGLKQKDVFIDLMDKCFSKQTVTGLSVTLTLCKLIANEKTYSKEDKIELIKELETKCGKTLLDTERRMIVFNNAKEMILS